LSGTFFGISELRPRPSPEFFNIGIYFYFEVLCDVAKNFFF